MKNLLISAGMAAALSLMGHSAYAEPHYMIAQIDVADWDRYMSEYGAAAGPTVFSNQGKILVATSEVEQLEGEWVGNWTVILEFPNENAAKAWYDDPAYVEARPLRVETSHASHMVFAPGFVPPSE